MTPEEQTRKLVDKFNKTYANNPLLATGGDNRSSAEAMNTGAIARMHGAQKKIPQVGKTVPLKELMKPNAYNINWGGQSISQGAKDPGTLWGPARTPTRQSKWPPRPGKQ